MINYEILPNKRVEIIKDENTFVSENLISSFLISLPSRFGDYSIQELNLEMRVYLSDDEYIPYQIDTKNSSDKVPITNDITEKAQTIKIMFIATKNGNVVGKTNQIEKKILTAPLKGEPLTPRAEFDETINGLREDVAELTAANETLTQQHSEDKLTISGLNSQISEMTTENAEQAATITRQASEIQYMLDNPPTPQLETPDPVTPTAQQQTIRPSAGYAGLSAVVVNGTPQPRFESRQVTPAFGQTQYIEPQEGYDGLSSVTINPITADLIPNLEAQNIARNAVVGGIPGTFDSFPENPVGGIYLYDPDENDKPTRLKIYNCNKLPSFSNNTNLKYIDLRDSGITSIGQSIFQNCSSVTELILPTGLTSIGQYAFQGMSQLTELNLPSTLTTIGADSITRLGITYLFVPKSVVTMNNYALRENGALTTAEFENGCTIIGNSCFYSTTGLRTVIIPDSVSAIGTQAFQSCTGLTTLHIPASLATLGANAFNLCTSLKNVTMGNGFNYNGLSLSVSTKYTAETIVGWLNALADRTGQTAYTLTIGSTNKNKLTAEEIAIAINKNWNLA